MDVLIITTHGVERDEVELLKHYLSRKGLSCEIASPHGEPVRTWANEEWQQRIAVDKSLIKVRVEDYLIVVVPGGQLHSDSLRVNECAVDIVRTAYTQKRIVAASRHGVLLLIETGIAKGHQITSCVSLRTDVINAGAEWSGADIQTDRGLITVRKAGLPRFAEAIHQEVPKAEHRRKILVKRYHTVFERA